MKTKINSDNILSTIEKATYGQRPFVELTPEQKESLKTVAGVALTVIAAAGVIAIAAVAPNVLQVINKVYRVSRSKKYSFKEKQVKTAQTFYYLKRHGLIEVVSSKRGLLARVTLKGKRKIEELNIDTLRVKPPRNWGGDWWVVAADIPTKDYRWAADSFRKKIRQMGFYPLQRTLWLYPYDPVKEIEYLANYFGIGRFVTVMKVSELDKDDEKKLKKFYKLQFHLQKITNVRNCK